MFGATNNNITIHFFENYAGNVQLILTVSPSNGKLTYYAFI